MPGGICAGHVRHTVAEHSASAIGMRDSAALLADVRRQRADVYALCVPNTDELCRTEGKSDSSPRGIGRGEGTDPWRLISLPWRIVLDGTETLNRPSDGL